MTTPRDDIAVLSERLRISLAGVAREESGGDNLAILLASYFEPGIEDEELDDSGSWKQGALDACDRVLDAIHAHYATAIDSLQARVKELEAERDKWDRRTAYDELKAREFENRATQQRQIDALTIRAEAAESRALRAEQERDKANNWQRWAEDQRAKFKQERDEAYGRLKALVEADALAGVRKLVAGWNGEDRPEGPFNERHPDRLGATLPKTNCGAIYQLDDAMAAARDLVRRLAGPEKEGK